MDEKELARIEKWLADVPEIESSWAAAIVTQDVASLIAEVRRLKEQNENLAGELRDEKAYAKELRDNMGQAGIY